MLPPRSAQPTPVWTTQDEIRFVNHLFEQGKLTELRFYLYNARRREWSGRGMSVEPALVIWAAEDAIKNLLEREHNTEGL